MAGSWKRAKIKELVGCLRWMWRGRVSQVVLTGERERKEMSSVELEDVNTIRHCVKKLHAFCLIVVASDTGML
ncbi:hypothetical protein vseg_019711 [Gypsophila vaccaria]